MYTLIKLILEMIKKLEKSTQLLNFHKTFNKITTHVRSHMYISIESIVSCIIPHWILSLLTQVNEMYKLLTPLIKNENYVYRETLVDFVDDKLFMFKYLLLFFIASLKTGCNI